MSKNCFLLVLSVAAIVVFAMIFVLALTPHGVYMEDGTFLLFEGKRRLYTSPGVLVEYDDGIDSIQLVYSSERVALLVVAAIAVVSSWINSMVMCFNIAYEIHER